MMRRGMAKEERSSKRPKKGGKKKRGDRRNTTSVEECQWSDNSGWARLPSMGHPQCHPPLRLCGYLSPCHRERDRDHPRCISWHCPKPHQC